MRRATVGLLGPLFTLLIAANAVSASSVTPVVVPGAAGWVSTGITVQAGTPVRVMTLGFVQTAKIPDFHVPGVTMSAAGPAGQVDQPTCGEVYWTWDAELQAITGPCVLDAAHWGELIGRVDGQVFLIGDTTSFTPPASGVLELAAADLQNTYGDNRGAFTVLFP